MKFEAVFRFRSLTPFPDPVSVSVAMGYGSLFATVITLFLVPLTYIAMADLGVYLRNVGRDFKEAWMGKPVAAGAPEGM